MPELDRGVPAGTDDADKVRVAHRRLREVLDRHRDGRDGEEPDDPLTVQVMPLVLEIPHDPLPARRAVLEAAATACVAVCLDPRAGEETGETTGAFAAALMSWYGARIRKIARRARNKKWRDVQALPGVTAEVDGARVRAFTPCPVSQTPALINRLQIEGTDLVDGSDDSPDGNSGDGSGGSSHGTPSDTSYGTPVIYVDSSLGMSVGKAAAQVAHGSMLLAAEMGADAALEWSAAGFPLEVREVRRELFAGLRARAEAVRQHDASSGYAAVVQDAGYTEVAPGSVTVVAVSGTVVAG
ncbi:MAG: peptidyl-tRNA hydrolase [Candidatus Corynebacterium faecigallinarum]|uniref:peptidyl-tRNA hydrolase n=1 Tax=Candidatus Corynebacterium faecigallinarum TaxID=2838528 RepID=UPI003FB9A1EC